MIAPPKPFNEKERIAELRRFDIIDSAPEPEFDDIIELASRICKAPISMISLVDDERQWFKSKIGLTLEEAERNTSFCGHAILNGDIMVVPDALKDQRFVDNPFVRADPNIRFYAGAPIVSNGYKLGTLCILDTVPRTITEEEIRTLKILAGQVRKLMELRLANKTLKLQLRIDQIQKEGLQLFGKTNSLLISVVRDKIGGTIRNIHSKLDNFEKRELSRDVIFSLFNEVAQQLSGTGVLIQNLAEWNESQMRVSDAENEPFSLDELYKEVEQKMLRVKPGVKKQVRTHFSADAMMHQHRSKLEFVLRNLLLKSLQIAPESNLYISATSDNDFVLVVINCDAESLFDVFTEKLQQKSVEPFLGEDLLDLFFIEEMILRLGGKLSVDKIEAMGTMISFTFRNR